MPEMNFRTSLISMRQKRGIMHFIMLWIAIAFCTGCASHKSHESSSDAVENNSEKLHKSQQHHSDHHHKIFKGAQEWAKEFDDPARDLWQKPESVIRELGLKSTSVVADLGAGTGYFSVRIAPHVLKGKVYAVDIEKDMLNYLSQRALAMKLENIKTIQATELGFRLDEKVDVILVVNTYHHIGQREAYFKTLLPQLNSEGKLVIVDFLPESPMGPPNQHRYQPPQIQQELQLAGYKLVRQKKLDYQFLLVFKKK